MSTANRFRGFTLMELMTAVAISGIVAGIVGGAVHGTHQGLVQQLDNAQAFKNGRVALEATEYFLRQAGYGFVTGTQATNSLFPIGQCKQSDSSVDSACNSVDSGSDRLRVAYAGSAGYSFSSSSLNGSTLTMGVSGQPAVPGHPWAVGTKVIISGSCDDNTPFAQLFTISAQGGTGSWYQQYSVTPASLCNATNKNISAAPKEDVANPLDKGLVVDLYVEKSAQPPILMMDRNDGSGAFPVAFYVEDFQVRYGVDTTLPDIDGTVEQWCDDLTSSSCGAGLSLGQKLGRIIGVQVAIVSRTPGPRALSNSSSLSVFDHTISGGDKYRRWVYSTTIALRNR